MRQNVDVEVTALTNPERTEKLRNFKERFLCHVRKSRYQDLQRDLWHLVIHVPDHKNKFRFNGFFYVFFLFNFVLTISRAWSQLWFHFGDLFYDKVFARRNWIVVDAFGPN